MFYAVVHLFKTINSIQLLDLEGLKVQHSSFFESPIFGRHLACIDPFRAK